VVERLAALEPNGPIDLAPVASALEAEGAPGGAAAAPDLPLAYQEARQAFERDYLRRLLAGAGGNVSEAARLSGIPRQNLYVRMKRWGVVAD